MGKPQGNERSSRFVLYLGAIAGLLTAVTGLLGALLAIGVFDDDPDSATPTTGAPTTVAAPATAAPATTAPTAAPPTTAAPTAAAPTAGQCATEGEGTVDVAPGRRYLIQWANTDFAFCDIFLVEA